MSKIIARIDSLSAKIANLKKVIRADANKFNKSKEDEDKSTDIKGALKAAIATPKATEKAKKRKNSEGTILRKPISIIKTVDDHRNGKQVEKTVEKISIKNNDNRETRRMPRQTKKDGGNSGEKCKTPLALSKQFSNR